MRYLTILLLVLFILISSGCVSSDTPDINELSELFNQNENIDIEITSIMTIKNEYLEHIYIYDDHLLFKAYADEGNRIICCSLTSDVSDYKFTKYILQTLLKELCRANEETIIKITDDMNSQKEFKINGWNYKHYDSPVAYNYILFTDTFEYNSSDLPILKSNISK